MSPILCSLWDKNYLAKGLALIESLKRHHADFRLFVLALDDATYQAIRQLHDKRVDVMPLSLIEYAELLRVKRERSQVEYCWTLTSFWMKWLMDATFTLERGSLAQLAYIDADMYLFGSLDSLYREVENSKASIAITPHRFPPRLREREQLNGIYNVGWVWLKNDDSARACLQEWTANCLDWCYQRNETDAAGNLLFGDQGYFNRLVPKYGIHVVKNIGVGLAPWNQEQYEYTYDNRLYVIQHTPRLDQGEPGIQRIDPVSLYHFHGLELVNGKPDHARRGGYKLKDEIIRYCYQPYESELERIARSL